MNWLFLILLISRIEDFAAKKKKVEFISDSFWIINATINR